MWLSYKTFTLYSRKQKPERFAWRQLYGQFGADPSKVDDKDIVNDFRRDALRELKKLKAAWPALNYATPTGYLEVRPCPPSIPPKTITA